MSATEQLAAPTLALAVDPSRMAVRLDVALPAGASKLTVWRTATASGHDAFVRGYVSHDVAGAPSALVWDWEVPFGVELVYYAYAVDAGGAYSPWGYAGPITVDDDRDWLVDLGRPTNSLPVLVEAMPELDYSAPVGVQRVLERRDPVLTTAPVWTPAAKLSVIGETELERDRLRAILGAGLPVLLRTPPEHGVGNLYFGVTGLAEQRLSRLALHEDRRFAVDLVQVARPDASIFVPVPPVTYADVRATWPTYAELLATGHSYQDVLYAFDAAGSGGGDLYPDWLPDDV